MEMIWGAFLLFVDLKKAFDTVDRKISWFLLGKKCGVPENVVTTIQNLHDGMTARTLYKGEVGQRFDMSKGVRQGSIEGQTLWNIFYALLLLDWTKRCKEKLRNGGGVSCEYTLDEALRTGEDNAKRSSSTLMI